jgi:hypothetical protein
LHRAHRDRDPSAAGRIAAHHPEMKGSLPEAVLDKPLALADTQLVVAREYGFRNWAELKHRIEQAGQIQRIEPHPGFDAALAALNDGDVDRLRAPLAADPSLVRARGRTSIRRTATFSGATLLHHVAGNPYRDKPLPPNVLDLARVLLDAGADVHARTLGPNGGDTMGLLVTGKQASDMGVTGPLMDLLLQRGARLDLTPDDALDASLTNHSPSAAEKMIELGAKADVLAAAALGRMDLLRDFFDRNGRLLARPRRHDKEMPERDAIGLALVRAWTARGRRGIEDIDGLHSHDETRREELVRFLLQKGADPNIVAGNGLTALDMADACGATRIAALLEQHGGKRTTESANPSPHPEA